LCEHPGFIFQLNETGRKFARKGLLVEFLQAQKIVDVTMVGRFSEESLHTGDR